MQIVVFSENASQVKSSGFIRKIMLFENENVIQRGKCKYNQQSTRVGVINFPLAKHPYNQIYKLLNL